MTPWAVLFRLLIKHKFHWGQPPLGARAGGGSVPRKPPPLLLTLFLAKSQGDTQPQPEADP